MRNRVTILGSTVLVLAACGGGGSPSTTTATIDTSTTTSTTTTVVTGTGTAPPATAVAVGSVALSPAANTVNPGGSFQLTASLKDAAGNVLSGRVVSWASSNPASATVSSAGVVTGVAAGSATLTASSEGKVGSATVTVMNAAAATVQVKVDLSKPGAAFRDVLGVNRKPIEASQTAGTSWSGVSLYKAFNVSQIRLHDSGVDLCTIYTAATKVNNGVSPAQTVSGCMLPGGTTGARFTWTPTSSADADLNNPNNYDFSTADAAILAALDTGAGIYLRLGEGTGPNDTSDPVAWAKVATNIYKHVIGVFKPTAGVAVNPAYVEILNEPDGGFWRGDLATFNTLFIETSQRVKAAAAAAGRTVIVGGAGFTKSVLTTSSITGNPAKNFIANVGASNLDFFSAHLYDNCSTATLANSATYLRGLRALVNSQGGSSKPLIISEWNIGLVPQCANSQYAEQRVQSFDSGVMSLMQDPAQNIQAAHYYAGMPIMGLFDFSAAANAVRINPSAWAFWAHGKLKGSTSVQAQVCPQGASCVMGYAAESAALMAVAGQANGAQTVVVTNDTGAAVTYTLQVDGLSAPTVTASISTPPPGTRDIPVSGNPAVADATALASLLTSPTVDARTALTPQAGQVQLTIVVPAYTVQAIELKTP